MIPLMACDIEAMQDVTEEIITRALQCDPDAQFAEEMAAWSAASDRALLNDDSWMTTQRASQAFTENRPGTPEAATIERD